MCCRTRDPTSSYVREMTVTGHNSPGVSSVGVLRVQNHINQSEMPLIIKNKLDTQMKMCEKNKFVSNTK